MKLVVGGVSYDGDSAPFLGDLRAMKKEFGLGYGTVIEQMRRVGKEPFLALVDDDGFVAAIMAWMWVTRLRAGERDLSADTVRMTAIDDVRLVDDDDEVESGTDGEADPTAPSAPTDSAAAAEGLAAAAAE